MIEFRNLSKTYAGAAPAALRDVNLFIPRGGVFGVIGSSGAGKSTLIRMINRLERPTSGEVWVEGQNIATFDAAGLSMFRRRVGMIFQQFGLLASKTALQNVMFPLRLAGQSTTAAEAKARALLHRVGLEEHAKKYPAQLSGGQKQRVGIARALANDPDILLCDEATSALDPQATRDILHLLSALNRDLGLTIVLITHEMEVVRQVCDQVAVLDGGSVVETGAVADVFLHPRHSATRRLVREADAGDAQGLIGPVFRLGVTGGEAAGRSLIAALAGLGDDIQVLTCRVAAIKETPYALARIAVAEPKLEATVAKLRAASVHVEAEA